MNTVFWLQQDYKSINVGHSLLTILIVAELQKSIFPTPVFGHSSYARQVLILRCLSFLAADYFS
jgi:hypothetical protein